MERFRIKKKSTTRSRTPTFVTDAVATAVEIATEQRIMERIKAAQETIDFGGSEEDNSLLESEHDEPAEDVEDDVEEDALVKELTSDFRKYSCNNEVFYKDLDMLRYVSQQADQQRYMKLVSECQSVSGCIRCTVYFKAIFLTCVVLFSIRRDASR